jgi:hypothetical protein
MNLIDRAEVLLQHGNMLMTRTSGCYIVTLYRIENFFTEVWYCVQTPKIHRIEPVRIEDVYHLYEKDIDISDIHNSC